MVLGPRVVEWIAEHIGLGRAFVTLWIWVRIPVAVLLLMLTRTIIYHALPNVDQPFRLITPGAVLDMIVRLIASLTFSYYASPSAPTVQPTGAPRA